MFISRPMKHRAAIFPPRMSKASLLLWMKTYLSGLRLPAAWRAW
jgi:hypothetical protein